LLDRELENDSSLPSFWETSFGFVNWCTLKCRVTMYSHWLLIIDRRQMSSKNICKLALCVIIQSCSFTWNVCAASNCDDCEFENNFWSSAEKSSIGWCGPSKESELWVENIVNQIYLTHCGSRSTPPLPDRLRDHSDSHCCMVGPQTWGTEEDSLT
jgi:hypothetical protein